MGFPVPVGPFAPFNGVGGDPGNLGSFISVAGPHNDYWSNAQLLKSLQVKYDDESLCYLRLTWADGSVTECGDGDVNHWAKEDSGQIDFDYANGERFTELTLWGNGHGAFCGAMRFKTTKRPDGITINQNKANGDGYRTDVGCGILVGFCGLSGWRLDTLCAIFLAKTVVGIEMTDISPNDPNWGSQQPQEVSLADAYVDASNSSTPIDWQLTSSRGFTSSWSYSSSITSTMGLSTAVKGSIAVAEVTATATWQIAVGTTSTLSGTSSVGSGITFNGSTPAHTKEHVSMITYGGTIDRLPYKCKVHLLFDDGHGNLQRMIFNDSGEYSGAMCSSARVKKVPVVGEPPAFFESQDRTVLPSKPASTIKSNITEVAPSRLVSV